MLNTVLSINKQIVFNAQSQIITRHFYRWLILMFNGVDQERVKKVGPDRACAEWLLRNGAGVMWKNSSEYLKDYNLLPDETERYHIQAVDATDSAIHHVGFPHFSGCKFIEEIKLVKCNFIENDALPMLSLVKSSLNRLEVIECKNITDSGLLELKTLTNLKTLTLGGLPYVKEQSKVTSELSSALPNCKITYF